MQAPEDDIPAVETAVIAEPEAAILERGGIHFVNSSVFTPDQQTEAALDADFRNLVDSVMPPNTP